MKTLLKDLVCILVQLPLKSQLITGESKLNTILLLIEIFLLILHRIDLKECISFYFNKKSVIDLKAM